jgi:hypothetical protein
MSRRHPLVRNNSSATFDSLRQIIVEPPPVHIFGRSMAKQACQPKLEGSFRTLRITRSSSSFSSSRSFRTTASSSSPPMCTPSGKEEQEEEPHTVLLRGRRRTTFVYRVLCQHDTPICCVPLVLPFALLADLGLVCIRFLTLALCCGSGCCFCCRLSTSQRTKKKDARRHGHRSRNTTTLLLLTPSGRKASHPFGES